MRISTRDFFIRSADGIMGFQPQPASINVSLENNGMPKKKKCPQCKGSGSNSPGVECPVCKGEGNIEE